MRRWQLFDASAGGLVLVETLSEHDDLLEALDVAREQAAYLAGRRLSAALPQTRILSPRRAV